jgi:hypothetical protein
MNSMAICLLVANLFRLSGSAGAESFCDPNLPVGGKSPKDYKMRGDRCEGTYFQQVAAISLEVRSLVKGFGPFNPEQDSAVVLAWTPPPNGQRPVYLRAYSFKPRTYFRMDTKVPPVSSSYRWPTDVLASENLGWDDLGVLAWTEIPGSAGSREVYLPLRVGAGSAAGQGYEVSLFPSDALKEVRITVTRLDAKGNVEAVLRKNEELGYGYYPAYQPTVFSTGKLGPAGFYRLSITAVPKSGSPAQQDLELFHSGD